MSSRRIENETAKNTDDPTNVGEIASTWRADATPPPQVGDELSDLPPPSTPVQKSQGPVDSATQTELAYAPQLNLSAPAAADDSSSPFRHHTTAEQSQSVQSAGAVGEAARPTQPNALRQSATGQYPSGQQPSQPTGRLTPTRTAESMERYTLIDASTLPVVVPAAVTGELPRIEPHRKPMTKPATRLPASPTVEQAHSNGPGAISGTTETNGGSLRPTQGENALAKPDPVDPRKSAPPQGQPAQSESASGPGAQMVNEEPAPQIWVSEPDGQDDTPGPSHSAVGTQVASPASATPSRRSLRARQNQVPGSLPANSTTPHAASTSTSGQAGSQPPTHVAPIATAMQSQPAAGQGSPAQTTTNPLAGGPLRQSVRPGVRIETSVGSANASQATPVSVASPTVSGPAFKAGQATQVAAADAPEKQAAPAVPTSSSAPTTGSSTSANAAPAIDLHTDQASADQISVAQTSAAQASVTSIPGETAAAQESRTATPVPQRRRAAGGWRPSARRGPSTGLSPAVVPTMSPDATPGPQETPGAPTANTLTGDRESTGKQGKRQSGRLVRIKGGTLGPQKQTRPVLIGVAIATILGSAAVFGSLYMTAGNRTEVLVAAGDIQPGEKISASQLRVALAAGDNFKAIRASNRSLYVGKVSRAYIPQGSIVTKGHFEEQTGMQPGTVATPLELAAGRVPHGLTQGREITVWSIATNAAPGKNTVSERLVQRAKVTNMEATSNGGQILTIITTEEEAQKLAALAAKRSVTVSLLPVQNTETP